MYRFPSPWALPALFAVAVVMPLHAQAILITAETNAAWMFADGKIERDNSPFTITYAVDTAAGTVTRVALRNTRTGQLSEDDTKYIVAARMMSHDWAALTLGRSRPFGPVIRALGSPGADALEILIIGPDIVRVVRSTNNYVLLVDMRRTK